MTRSAIDMHYRERTWTRHDVFPMQGEESAPTTESELTCFHSDSGRRAQVENYLGRLSDERKVEVMGKYLIWDYELLSADAVELAGNGGSVRTLSEDWKGHPAGSIVMEVYVKAERGVSFAVFIAS